MIKWESVKAKPIAECIPDLLMFSESQGILRGTYSFGKFEANGSIIWDVTHYSEANEPITNDPSKLQAITSQVIDTERIGSMVNTLPSIFTELACIVNELYIPRIIGADGTKLCPADINTIECPSGYEVAMNSLRLKHEEVKRCK